MRLASEEDVRYKARRAIHLQLDIKANPLEIRAVQSPTCIVWCPVDCTFGATCIYSFG
jgi:hypothetical protein